MAKQIFKVDIDPDVADRVKDVFDVRAGGYARGTERLFRWFLEQDEMMQALVLGMVPEKYAGEAAQMTLERIAQKQKPTGKIATRGTSLPIPRPQRGSGK